MLRRHALLTLPPIPGAHVMGRTHHVHCVGIKQLEIQPPGSDGRKTFEATGAFAADGEYLPFVTPVAAEGPPELWLSRVESSMFASIKKLLYKARFALGEEKTPIVQLAKLLI